MLTIQLNNKESNNIKKGQLILEKYEFSYPYSIYVKNNNRPLYLSYSMNSFECENTQASFYLYYYRKIEIPKTTNTNYKFVKNENVKLTALKNTNDSSVIQNLLLQKRQLYFFKENNFSSKKSLQTLPYILIKDEETAKSTLQFHLKYIDGSPALKSGEKITIRFNLFET